MKVKILSGTKDSLDGQVEAYLEEHKVTATDLVTVQFGKDEQDGRDGYWCAILRKDIAQRDSDYRL